MLMKVKTPDGTRDMVEFDMGDDGDGALVRRTIMEQVSSREVGSYRL